MFSPQHVDLVLNWPANMPGPLARYVNLRVVHAQGMPGRYSPATAIPTCIRARAARTCCDAVSEIARRTDARDQQKQRRSSKKTVYAGPKDQQSVLVFGNSHFPNIVPNMFQSSKQFSHLNSHGFQVQNLIARPKGVPPKAARPKDRLFRLHASWIYLSYAGFDCLAAILCH